jgi:hypothetical protein
MSQIKAARRYARALFELAQEQRQAWMRCRPTWPNRWAPCWSEAPELRALLGDLLLSCQPAEPKVLGELFERQGHADPLTLRFVLFLS